MGITGDVVTYTSNSFDVLHEHALKLIDAGLAYADDTPQEQVRRTTRPDLSAQMRAERMDGTASIHRDDAPAAVHERFAAMAAGTGPQWCLRAKISATDPNKALRDPVIYRCNETPHHRTESVQRMRNC